jgi:phosphatidate cytidylyltransferase
MRRLITAIGLLAIAFYLIFLAPHVIFLAGALCMSLLCYWEFGKLVAAHSIPAPGVYGLIAGLVILFWPQIALFAGISLPAGLTVLMIAAFIASLRHANLRDVLPAVACVLLGAFYAFAPWRFAIDLRKESVHLLFFALALNWAGDTCAYYAGRRFGRHKFAPVVSPKKSWEGALASIAGSVIFGLVYLGHFLPLLPAWKITGFAILGNIAGQFGDLAESAMKRGAGMKDSSNILPGHGGILDRVDSSLFALPIIYILYLITRGIK